MAIKQDDAFQKDQSMIVQGAGQLTSYALISAGLQNISMTLVEPGTGLASPATTPTQMMETPEVGQQAAMAGPANNAIPAISTPQMGMR